MRITTLLIAAVLMAFLIGCQLDQSSEQIYVCKCTSIRIAPSSGERGIKDAYIFLVKGESGAKCCETPAMKSYTGFHEIWKTEPVHSNVWKRDLREALPSKDAQKIGCNASDRVIDFVELGESPRYLEEYYPELADKYKQIK